MDDVSRMFGMTVAAGMALSALVVVLITTNETRKEAKPTSVEAKLPTPQDQPAQNTRTFRREDVEHTTHLQACQRRILATLMLCAMGTIVDSRLENIYRSLNAEARYSIHYGLQSFILAAGFNLGQEMNSAESDMLVAELTANQNFFWFCVKWLPLIERMQEIGFTVTTPDGDPIPEEILPSEHALKRLRSLFEHFEQNQAENNS